MPAMDGTNLIYIPRKDVTRCDNASHGEQSARIQGMGAGAGTPSSTGRLWFKSQAAIPRALPPPPAGIFTPNPGCSQARMHVLSTSVWQMATLLVPDPIGSCHHRQTAPVSAVNLSIVLLIPAASPSHQKSLSGYRGNAGLRLCESSVSFFQHHLQQVAAGLEGTAGVALPIGCSLDEYPSVL
jgi:hypothetical protein